jgi:hypothetical protein
MAVSNTRYPMRGVHYSIWRKAKRRHFQSEIIIVQNFRQPLFFVSCRWYHWISQQHIEGEWRRILYGLTEKVTTVTFCDLMPCSSAEESLTYSSTMNSEGRRTSARLPRALSQKMVLLIIIAVRVSIQQVISGQQQTSTTFEFFCILMLYLPAASRPALGPTQPPIQGYRRFFHRG